jgi:parallel beta-helix repeat protein
MAEGVKVFFSYSHKDEQLRDELAKHLSAMRRQGVIAEWHDRKITAGNEWAGEIDENLNRADIILLLISADFIASDYCYDVELKRAMARHEAGSARVIPIILRPVDWSGEAFSKLQALPKDAKPVVQWPTLDEGFVDVARGIRAAVEAWKAGRMSGPSGKYATHIVDQMHRGDFVTISEAIAAARPGDRILVRPGFYQEGFVIDKPLEIVGDGERDEIVIQANGRNVVQFMTTRGRIINLTIRQTGGDGKAGVNILQGRLELEDCDISSQSSSCVAILSGADPRLRRNLIRDGKQSGVFVYENAQGVLEENEIFRNAFSGVEIATGANPVIRRNRIHASKSSGIYVHDKGQGILEENKIFENAFSGIIIRTDTNSIIRNNSIHDNKQSGIFVHDNGRGILEDNDIFMNGHSGVWIQEGSNIFMQRNRITNNGYEAISIRTGSGGTFEDNDLQDNAMGPWYIDESSLPNVTRRNNNPNE